MKLACKLFYSFSLFILASCATTTQRAMEKIEVGMDKAQVLSIAGDPETTERNDGSDEWTYAYYISKSKEFTKVFFKYGKVTKIEDYDPSNDDLNNSYKDYSDKVKQKRKEKKKLLKDLDE